MPIHRATIMSGVIAILFTAVFLLDVLTPLGLPVSVLYVVPLALTSLLRRREAPYWLAGAASAATLCGYFLSPSLSGIPSWLPVNRAIGVALLWLTASVIRRQRDMADHLIHAATIEAENHSLLVKQQALQRQADEIQDLYNQAPCGYHSLDAMGRYVEVNETELQWLGYRREDMIGRRRFRDLLVPQSARRFDEVFLRFVTQGSIHDLELDIVRKDHSVLSVSLCATAIRDAEGRYITSRSTIVDLTRRRRTEEVRRQAHDILTHEVREYNSALRAGEEETKRARDYAEATLRTSPVPLLVLENDLRVNTANEAFYHTFKINPAETQGRLVYDLGNGQWNIPALRELLEHVLPQHTVLKHFEVTHDFESIGRRTMLLNARRMENEPDTPARIVLVIEDITERKQTEAAKAMLANIVESSDDAIVSKDLNGIITSWNAGAENLFGYTAEDAVGQPVLMLIPPDRVDEEPHILERIGRGESIEHYETVRRHKDGTLLDISLTVSPILDSQGRITGASKIARDISERKKAEMALVNKTKDLETLLYVTSHDLKEPLRAIESFSQLVLERYADRIDERGKDYLRRSVRATERLDRLLSDILELSRAHRMLPPMEEVEAEALVKEALARLDHRIQETGAAVRIVSPLPRLRVNRTWATQGLYNLLANALKFTRDGSAPDIEIAPYEVHTSETSFAGVVVKDRGPGVPTRQAERIFMLFQRAVGRDVEGTGAGLAIVEQVAERHGGRAWVRPRAGGGSEFVMTFACPTHNNNGGASPI
jgi:PAS domain S-box-containing protein